MIMRTVANMKQVCIVGAGMAGLCSARRSLEYNMKATVYEQTDKIGGTWVYTDQVGTDEYNLEIHSSMYEGLKTNIPKEVMGYPDFDISDCEDSYVSSEVVKNFLEKYAENYELEKCIKFRHHVLNIQPKPDNKWQVIVKDLKTQIIHHEYFDHVFVCNGHYHTPLFPTIQGADLYKGFQMHSHDYRNSKQFKDETVLIIGSGPSGLDLCYEIAKVAKRVTLSHHTPEGLKREFPSNVYEKPDVKYMDENYVYFTDGTREKYSIIFYCTGYKYSFPFLSMDCGIYVEDNCVQSLFKHCINISHPSMALIGLPFFVCTGQLCDMQARFCLKFWTKQKTLPTTQEMLDDTRRELGERLTKGLPKHKAHLMLEQQANYFKELATLADIENIKPVVISLFNETMKRFLENNLSFRNDRYRIIDDENFIKIN